MGLRVTSASSRSIRLPVRVAVARMATTTLTAAENASGIGPELRLRAREERRLVLVVHGERALPGPHQAVIGAAPERSESAAAAAARSRRKRARWSRRR